MAENLERLWKDLSAARIEQAYVDMRHPDGDVDLVVVADGGVLMLRGGCARRTVHERWMKELSYEDCQRWLVGAEILDVVAKDDGRSLTLWLSNGVVVTGVAA